MSDDNQALLLQISYDLNKLKNDWNKANGIADDGASRMERRARKMAQQTEGDMGRAGTGAGKAFAKGFTGEAGKAVVFNRMQMMELAHVGRSVFDGLAAGQNPIRILALEGGRLAEVFGMGAHGAGGTMAALAPLLNPVTIGFAAVAVAVLGCVAAELSYEDAHRKLLIALMGTAAASGFTVNSLNAVAEAAAKVDKISIATARDAAVSFASIGHVTEENMGAALAVLRDYATLMGMKAPDAARELAKAFADPAKGAEELNDKLYFLNEGQMETIRHMELSGDRAGALKALLDDLRDATDGAATHMGGLSQAMEAVGKAFGDAFDQAGKFFDRLNNPTSGMNYDQLTAYLKKEIAQDKAALANPMQLDKEDLQTIVDQYQKQLDAAIKEHNRSLEAPVDKAAADDRSIASRSDPKFQRIKDDKAEVEHWEDRLKHPLLDPLTGKRTDAKGNYVGYTDDEIKELLAGSKAKLARDEHGEMRMPHAKKGPEDQGASAVDEANKAKSQALAALQEDVLEKAKAEKDVIDDELKAQLESLKNKHIKAKADRDAAEQALRDAADLKKQAVDIKAQNELEKQAFERHRKREELEIQLLNTQAAMATTLKQRQALELAALDRKKALEDAQRKVDLDARRRLAEAADKARGDGSVTVVGDDGAQKAADKAYDLQKRQITSAGPLNDYVKGIQDLDTEMQTAGVKAIQGVNDALAQVIVTGGKLGNILHRVLQQLELDLAKMAIQQAEKPIFAALGLPGFDGGGYTGSGSRSGGLDGKGGFMAVLHPNETVIDHTRGAPNIVSSSSSRAAGAPIVVAGPTFHLQGAVMTQDLLNQMNAMSRQHAAQAAATAINVSQRAQGAWAARNAYEKG